MSLRANSPEVVIFKESPKPAKDFFGEKQKISKHNHAKIFDSIKSNIKSSKLIQRLLINSSNVFAQDNDLTTGVLSTGNNSTDFTRGITD